VSSPELTMVDAALVRPRPVRQRIPLLLGTANTRLLRWGAENADLIGLTGFGRTLPDGHAHEVRWRLADVDRQVALAGGKPMEALVQFVAVTSDPESLLGEHANGLDMSVAELRQSPYVLVGGQDEIRAAIETHRARWGITRYAVRRPALEPAVLAALGLEPG
jgi:hypothetical protein